MDRYLRFESDRLILRPDCAADGDRDAHGEVETLDVDRWLIAAGRRNAAQAIVVEDRLSFLDRHAEERRLGDAGTIEAVARLRALHGCSQQAVVRVAKRRLQLLDDLR